MTAELGPAVKAPEDRLNRLQVHLDKGGSIRTKISFGDDLVEVSSRIENEVAELQITHLNNSEDVQTLRLRVGETQQLDGQTIRLSSISGGMAAYTLSSEQPLRFVFGSNTPSSVPHQYQNS